LSFDAKSRPAKANKQRGAAPAEPAKRLQVAGLKPRKTAQRGPKNQANERDLLAKPWTAERAPQPQRERRPVDTTLLREQDLLEAKVLGENASRVCFNKRPEQIVKMYLTEQCAPRFADVMKYLARNKKAYHLVSESDLEKVSGSSHHGGIVLVVKKREHIQISSYLTLHRKKQRDCLLALDGVGNPHNLGAIVRSCAHFGVSGLVLTEPELLQSGAASRTAEGGLEYIDALLAPTLPKALAELKAAGYSLITTSSHRGVSLYKSALPAKAVIVFGEEMDGVSSAVANSTDVALQIPGTGHVESLNVSVAASLILGEWYRQHSS
jgi:TrmH RNA methyltransferase